MKFIIGIILMVLGSVLIDNPSSGQLPTDSSPVNCLHEQVQVHLSHETAFTGEICWFKIYCTSTLPPGMEFSNLAFIELVSTNNTSIIRKKILLSHGEGTGDFVIPDNLSTGLYYILAYTNWMKNFGEETFFRKGFVIINPGQPFHNISDSTFFTTKPEKDDRADINQKVVEVIPDKKKYNTRERVMLKIKIAGVPTEPMSDSFSVSVYRKEPPMFTNVRANISEEAVVKDPGQITFLPDHTGILLSGKLTDPSGNALKDQTVILSAPGPGVDIKSNITNDLGYFHFLLKPRPAEQDVVITLPDGGSKIDLEDPFWNGFRKPPDSTVFGLDRNSVYFLKEKFAHYQLQSRFRKPEKYLPVNYPSDSNVFYMKPYQAIAMNNYVKMDSLREYFYELVPTVKFIQRRDDLEILVVDPQTLNYIEVKPGVFLDGVLYDNYAAIFKIPIDDIDRVSVLPNTYYYKDFTFGGIIDIHTKKSDFNSLRLLPNMARFRFPIADACEWKFTSPDYALTDSLERIPDFRYLLHWDPYIPVGKSGEASTQFYTGDVPGDFVVRVMGISRDGEILKAEMEIHVDD